MSQLEYIKNRTLTLSIPEGCSGCIHESNGICLLGFGQKSHDYEDLNFFNVVTGYHGLNTTDKVEQRWSRKSKACGN